MGQTGQLEIPVEFLTKKVPTDSGVVVPAQNDNNKILLILGAFIIGYALFSNDKTPN